MYPTMLYNNSNVFEQSYIIQMVSVRYVLRPDKSGKNSKLPYFVKEFNNHYYFMDELIWENSIVSQGLW